MKAENATRPVSHSASSSRLTGEQRSQQNEFVPDPRNPAEVRLRALMDKKISGKLAERRREPMSGSPSKEKKSVQGGLEAFRMRYDEIVFTRWCVILPFEFYTRFAPQCRAFFRHCNVQNWSEIFFSSFVFENLLRATKPCTFSHLNCHKCSDTQVLLAFWLRDVLRAATACTFGRSNLPKVLGG